MFLKILIFILSLASALPPAEAPSALSQEWVSAAVRRIQP